MIKKPKGCNDIIDKEAKIYKYIEEIVDGVMEKYNYNYIRTPIFESSELFHRGIGEASDIVTKETYDFKDRGDRNLTLRPEGTAGIVRCFIENKMYGDNLPKKFYYNETMYRYERPQAGRERELTQFGMEVLGSDDVLSDVEVISLAVNIYKMLGLKNIVVEINSLGDKDSRDNYRKALVDYFKPHKDRLCDDCKNRLDKNPLRILDCKVDGDSELFKKAPSILDYLNDESKERFDKVKEYLDIIGVKYKVNPNIVRGLDYYNHTVFEIKVESDNETNASVLGGGGRYNNLVEQLGGPSTPCVGFASGISRVVLALKENEVELPIDEKIDVFMMYVNEEEKKYALYLAQELRMAGFKVDTEYTGRGLKAQFRQADRLKSKFVIVLNSDDLNEGNIKIKNNETKEEEVISLEYLIYYLDEKLIDLDTCDCSHGDECTCGDECHCGDECTCGDNCNCRGDKHE